MKINKGNFVEIRTKKHTKKIQKRKTTIECRYSYLNRNLLSVSGRGKEIHTLFVFNKGSGVLVEY